MLASLRRSEEKARRLEERRAKVAGRVRPGVAAIIDPATHGRFLRGYDPHRNAAGFVFDADAAIEAVDFFHRHLVHVRGEWRGSSFRLEPWQQAIVMAIYGWKRPDGMRRYREVFIYVPRKNGKTVLSAGLALHSFFADDEPGSENICAAAERKQARLLWDVAREQLLLDPGLAGDCEIGAHAITHLDDPLKTLQAVSAEAGTKHGMNPHFAVVDEVHVQQDDRLVEAIRTGMGARRQPLLVYITTARHFDPEHICNRLHDHACKVRDGTVEDPSFLPVIYEAPADADWTSPEVWRDANPNYGISVKPEFLAAEMAKAKARPAEIDSFKRLYLNIRTNAESSALDMDLWDGCLQKYGAADLLGKRCFGGLDLSRSRDITAFALWFPAEGRSLVWQWIPKDNIVDAGMRDRVNYVQWANEGWVEPTPGDVVDYSYVAKRVVEACKEYAVESIGFDPHNAAAFVQHLMLNEGVPLVSFPQTPMHYNAGCKEIERLLASRGLAHNGNPLLRWEAANLVWRIDVNRNYAPHKGKSTGRIDGMSALLMAIGRSIATTVREWSGEVYAA